MIFQAKTQAKTFSIEFGSRNTDAVRAVMERDKTDQRGRGYYFTIIRDPLRLFISLWDYYELGNLYGMSLETYALSNKTGPLEDRRFWDFGRNQLMFDFGLDPKYFDDDVRVQQKIQEIDETFDLVIISEHFDNGIILLKRALCWSNEDIVYISHNAAQVGLKSNISEVAERRLKDWLRSDYKLYEYFKDKFEKTIALQSQQWMTTEIDNLARTNKQIYDACRVRRHKTPQRRWFWEYHFGRNVYQYRSNSMTYHCKYLVLEAGHFLNKLRVGQFCRAFAKVVGHFLYLILCLHPYLMLSSVVIALSYPACLLRRR